MRIYLLYECKKETLKAAQIQEAIKQNQKGVFYMLPSTEATLTFGDGKLVDVSCATLFILDLTYGLMNLRRFSVSCP